MKLRFYFLVAVVFLFGVSFAVDATALMEYAMEKDISFKQSYITYQQAVDDYQRSLVYSSTKLDEISAELSFTRAKADLRSSMKSLIDRVVGGYFDILIQKIQLEILENNATITENDLVDAQKLLEKGMVKESDVESISLNKEKTLINIETAKKNIETSIKNIFWYLGVDSTSITIPELNPLPNINENLCLSEDIIIKQASLSVLRSSLELDQLVSASEYDITKAKRNLNIAKLSYETTYHQRKNAIESTFYNLEIWKKELENLKKEYSLIEEELKEIKEKYEKGLADENDVLQKKNNLLSKQREILQKQKDIVTNYLKLMVDCGLFDDVR